MVQGNIGIPQTAYNQLLLQQFFFIINHEAISKLPIKKNKETMYVYVEQAILNVY